jgi:hypothetical protein
VSTRLVAAAALTVAALLVASCRSEGSDVPKPPRAFCEAAARYDDRVARRASLAEQIRLVERMAATAPAKINADAATFLDALRRVESDPSVKKDPKVKRAVENVNRYAAQSCGFYRRQPGGAI